MALSASPAIRSRLCAVLLLASAISASGCVDRRMQSAQAAIDDIEVALATSGTAPARYIPGQVSDVRHELDMLKRSFEQQEYPRVLRDAPAVLESARALPQAAAAREAALLRSLQADWAALERTLPSDIEAMRRRLQQLETAGHRPDGTSDDVGEVARQVDDAQALWGRALAERDAQRLPEALTVASQARGVLDRVAAGQPGLGAASGQVK
jgi:hypothetical protein